VSKSSDILRIFNKEDTDALQRFYANAFWQNNVTALRRSTIKVGSGHPLINVNYLVLNLHSHVQYTIETKLDKSL
jgi:hypothetical protein